MQQSPLNFPFGATQNKLNLTVATVVKASAGNVGVVVVNTAGSTAGGIYDTTTTGGAAAGTLIAAVEAAGVYNLAGFACLSGIVFVPGTGMVASISYS